MDTKRKLLSEKERNSGISQADMYQIYVNAKKYDAQKISFSTRCRTPCGEAISHSL
ncbi:MAG: hypothetical protein KGZ50_09445 [Peptococcaceae bacterium]|nr:hypothetical protein [Peptococcaceae bacterium]